MHLPGPAQVPWDTLHMLALQHAVCVHGLLSQLVSRVHAWHASDRIPSAPALMAMPSAPMPCVTCTHTR